MGKKDDTYWLKRSAGGFDGASSLKYSKEVSIVSHVCFPCGTYSIKYVSILVDIKQRGS